MNGTTLPANYFDLSHLTDLLSGLPFPILPSFYEKLVLFQERFSCQSHKPLSFIDDIQDIFTVPWHHVVDVSRDDIALIAAQNYKTVWHYIIDKMASPWALQGDMPIYLLPQLLTIIDGYYSGNLVHTKHLLADFIYSLTAISSLDMSHHFYGQPIECCGKTHYLLSLLLQCLDEHADLTDPLNAIAVWIYTQDHSLIATSHQLSTVYQQKRAGLYFDITALQQLVNQLMIKPDSLLVKTWEQLKKTINKADDIGLALINNLKALYHERWIEIIDTEEDYTRLITGANTAWIRLAQALAGCERLVSLGWISRNYYQLLIPTLDHDVTLLNNEPLVWYPLTSYIVSDNQRELIFLSDCIEHHKTHGTCYRPDKMPLTELTQKEKQRLAISSSSFHQYVLNHDDHHEDEPVSKKTIDAVKTMVEASLFYKGLRKGEEYTLQQMVSAYQAYDHFLTFVETLDASEKKNLYEQHILVASKRMTFADVMQKIQPNSGNRDSDEHCIASLSKFFLKMVVDYDPDSKFLKELEDNIAIDTLRLVSDKKVYADYNMISHDEAVKRIHSLYVSLLSRKFTFIIGYGTAISFWDCTNMVTGTCVKLEQKIHPMIHDGDYSQARFLYASLLETIVKPALLVSPLTRTAATRLWLESIADGSLFHPDNAIVFEPELLLQVLRQELKKQPERAALLEQFLDKVVHTFVQQDSETLKLLRVNIKFSQLLQSMDNHYQEDLLRRLRRPPVTLTKFTFLTNATEFVIHRLTCLALRKNKTHSFYFFSFDSNVTIDCPYYRQFSGRLRQQLKMMPISATSSISDILSHLQQFAATILTKYQHDAVAQYLQTITRMVPNHEVDCFLPIECEF